MHLDQYILMVKAKPEALKDLESLDLRIQILTRSVTSVLQVIAISHLAKSLDLKGQLEEAKVQMAAWGRLVTRKNREFTRWKQASMALHLHLTQKRNAEAKLKSADKKAGRQAQVNPDQVEKTCRQAQQTGYLWLFDQDDLVKPDNLVWTLRSQDQFGAWQ